MANDRGRSGRTAWLSQGLAVAIADAGRIAAGCVRSVRGRAQCRSHGDSRSEIPA